jgi:hypothetical protein
VLCDLLIQPSLSSTPGNYYLVTVSMVLPFPECHITNFGGAVLGLELDLILAG